MVVEIVEIVEIVVLDFIPSLSNIIVGTLFISEIGIFGRMVVVAKSLGNTSVADILSFVDFFSADAKLILWQNQHSKETTKQ